VSNDHFPPSLSLSVCCGTPIFPLVTKLINRRAAEIQRQQKAKEEEEKREREREMMMMMMMMNHTRKSFLSVLSVCLFCLVDGCFTPATRGLDINPWRDD
jgi:hypothetical protein